MTYIDQQKERVQECENIFKIGNLGAVSKVQIKVIKRIIQVDCPISWSIGKIMKNAN
jgi:hypothetical protein